MTFNWVWLEAALPEVFLASMVLLLLLVGAFVHKRIAPRLVWKLSLVSLVATAVLTLNIAVDLRPLYGLPTSNAPGELSLHALFIQDGFSSLVKLMLLGFTFLVLFMGNDYLKRMKLFSFEYFILILLSTLGGMVLVSAKSFLSFYLGLELMSFSLYVLTTYHRRNIRSSEAGLKYFLLGSLASGFILYGISLLYGLTGSVSFEGVQLALYGKTLYTEQFLMISMALVMILVAMFFKLNMVPFHVWVPDVYEGAPTPVTAYMAIVPKIASVAALIRILYEPLSALVVDWTPILIAVTIFSMVLGTTVAMLQINLKRLMAYSAIGHMGFLMVAVIASSREGVDAALFYLIMYGFTVIGIFSIMLSLRNREIYLEKLSDFKGLSKQAPKHAFALLIFFFSLAGLPPLGGFFAKMLAFKAALAEGYYVLVIVAVLCSVVAAVYSLILIRMMYFEKGGRTISPDYPISNSILTQVCVLMIICAGFISPYLLEKTHFASEGLYLGFRAVETVAQENGAVEEKQEVNHEA